MKKLLRQALPIIAIIAIVLILTNPSYRRFNQFAADLNVEPYKIITRKLNDCLIFSTYERKIYKQDDYSKKYELLMDEIYYGYLLNFHKK